MLHSKFAKKNNTFKAQKIFTDRVEPRAVFKQSVLSYADKPREIVVYYGKGGIGKTSLLKTLYTNSESVYSSQSDYKFKSVFVSLDSYDFANPVNILLAIRNGIDGDCGLFDYAMLQYCAKAKLNVEEIMQKNSILSAPIVGVLNELISLGTASACIPTATIRKCVSLIKDHQMKVKYKEEIEELDTLNEFDIFERLPYYLGLCINNAYEKGVFHVVFLDSYDSLLARTEYGTFSVEQEEWLQELFASSDALRLIIASRDRLRWDMQDAEWADYLQQHLLSNLSEEDSRWFLKQVPIQDERIIDTIVTNSAGVPLYLDMCVSIYEDNMNSGKEFEIDSKQTGEKIISRFIRHLSTKDKAAIKILAAPHFFDINFARALLQHQGIDYGSDELQQLLEKSIFLAIDEERGIWKVDESVRLHQRANIRKDKLLSVLEAILDCVNAEPKGNYFVHLSLVLETVIRTPDVLSSISEKCIQLVDYYANAGLWNELHQILESQVDSNVPELQALAVMEEAIWLRRTGKLEAALALTEAHPFGKEELGVWIYMYKYLCIQLKHLLGRYNESLAQYKALVDEMDLIRTLIPNHIYMAPAMKYADLLFLKGHFDESMEIVKKLLAENNLSTADEIELMRIEGHIYRFQGEYAKAELIYRNALELAEKKGLKAALGKLYNNMTEATCMDNPSKSLQWFEKSREINGSSDNGVELGKTYAATSAAYTRLGDTSHGLEFADLAITKAEKTGYRAGKAFGLAALYYALVVAGEDEKADKTKEELHLLIQDIGVYQYILKGIEK